MPTPALARIAAESRISGCTPPEPGRGETAQIGAADEETALQQDLLAAPAAHIARFASEAQPPLGHDRVEITEAYLAPHIIDPKALGVGVIAERSEVAARRF